MVDEIIVDTREQNPLFIGGVEDGVKLRTVSSKLDEGDYATFESEPFLVVERKSWKDLYSSLTVNHSRFRAMLQRANSKGKRIYVLVECPYDGFLYNIGESFKSKPETIAKMIKTIEAKYSVSFIWCSSREDMARKIVELFRSSELLKANIGKL